MSSPFLMDAPISRLEELFNRVGYPVDIRTRLYNANYDYDQPSLHLYSLLCPADLRFLRQVSKRAKLWAEQDMRKIFDIIVVDERLKQLSRSEAIMDLCSIAPYCRQIVFRFDEADICTNPLCTVFADINLDSTNEESFTQSTNPSFTQDAETWTSTHHRQSDWFVILETIPHVEAITISSFDKSKHSPAGAASIDHRQVALRTAIENSNLRQLRCLRFEPIPAMSIRNFRWSGLTSIDDATWMAGAVWKRINYLELQILNPFGHLQPSEARCFLKILHSFLASFARQIRVLKFYWVGNVAPNPLLLDQAYRRGDWSSPALRCSRLRELWLGNVDVNEEQLEMVGQRAPRLSRFMLLKDDINDNKVLLDFELPGWFNEYTYKLPNWVDRVAMADEDDEVERSSAWERVATAQEGLFPDTDPNFLPLPLFAGRP